MIEFFNNIWDWVISNKDGIVTFFASGSFIVTLSSIITVVKSIKSNNKNTLSINTINSTIENSNNISKDVTETKNFVQAQSEEIELLKEQNESLNDKIQHLESEVITKLNHMFDLYSVVYSTVRDDTVREAANNILMKAKYSSDVSKEMLEKQVEELKTKMSEKISDMQNAVDETVNDVKIAVTNVTEMVKDKSKLKRY